MTILPIEPPAVAVAPAGRFSIQLYSPTPNGPVNWRLLSANNRECGRGSESFEDAKSCQAFITELRGQVAHLQRRCRRTDAGRWGWELVLDGQTLANSGRTFDRLLRCEQSAGIFSTEIVAAPVRATLIVSGSRRWGSVA